MEVLCVGLYTDQNYFAKQSQYQKRKIKKVVKFFLSIFR